MASYCNHLEDLTRDLSGKFPGNDVFISQLTTLITTYPPLFIYIHDPNTARITASLVEDTLQAVSAFDPSNFAPEDHAPQVAFAQVNAINCFTPRLFYDTALNSLARWRPQWEQGCENWVGEGEVLRYNDTFDAFMHGLRALELELSETEDELPSNHGRRSKGKGKAKEKVVNEDVRMVLVVEKAERLKFSFPELIIPLTRLAELSQVDITTIFISEVPWEDIKPSLGASLDPYRMVISPPTKQATIEILNSYFPSVSISNTDPHAHHPSLAPLYSFFVSALYSICSPFTNDPHELAYIAAARWPGFVQPVIDAHALELEALREDDPDAELPLTPPAEDARLRLLRYFTPSFTLALEALYPRLTNATDWARANSLEPGTMDPTKSVPSSPRKDKGKARDVGDQDTESDADPIARVLPRMSKFILVAAFLASTNPSKTDLRMFGRGVDEKRRRRKGGGGRRTAGKSSQAKVPQRLLGPIAFPLDRLLAILAVLLEEYDFEERLPAPEFELPGEETEMELGRVHLYGAVGFVVKIFMRTASKLCFCNSIQVVELSTMSLLHRTSPPEKFDGPATFRCGISYEVALALARDLQVPLLDLMWDSN
ncbi:hypothetical protein EW146_g5606 [Bondarzewia mesenterica]|uniref:Uncharacterized protein n=1 Tax=Bondarzewia mesenterica TaxID=1095465 RepID=A0A4V3XES6_9AGAM|nr:hypothetical protein EW146_g5606 [Bondarzewia mesenterica]